MWFTRVIQHKDGYWTLCTVSDEDGGFHEGCQHRHQSQEEAYACLGS